MDRHPTRWAIGIALGLVLLGAGCECEMQCTLVENRLATYYELSTTARNGILFKEGQSTSGFQGLDCTCGTNNEALTDAAVTTFNDDVRLFKEGSYDWKKSAVVKIANCERLEVSMRRGANDLGPKLSGAILIIENVSELRLQQFGVALKGTGQNSQNDTFTSINFKNVTFASFPIAGRPKLTFEEKVEVLFYRVKLAPGVVFHVNFLNRDNAIDPSVRIEESEFAGPESLNKALDSNDETFKILVKNEQFGEDSNSANNEACHFDYKGEVVIAKNKMGLLRLDNVEVTGAKRVEFQDNLVQTATADAVIVDSVKEFLFRRNNFLSILSQPLVELVFIKKARAGCPTDDLPESAVKAINFSGNRFAKLKKTPFKIDAKDYSKGFLDQMEVVNNTIDTLCECEDKILAQDATDGEKLFMRLQTQSQCISEAKGEPLIGLRSDICQGNHPLTAQEREDMLRDDLISKWTTYLIIGIIASLIVAVAATLLIVKMCCNNSNADVTPRGRDF
eukprot:maker-scaffold524_size146631-snap-gene-0.25 protein:Tk03326 transcript:maker-scaffold524_size146631-snap-gene-0.25-mRNA-1 annotation:"hypothetical protein"